MLKTFFTLMRGAAAAAEEAVTDRNALLILKQQIRDAAVAVERSRQALAIAIAQEQTESKRLETTLSRIADLEERATAALAAGSDDLAREAAGMIAMMEADRNAIEEARAACSTEISRLRFIVTQASSRLADLERGRRVAEAAEAVRRLRSSTRASAHTGSAGDASALADAEATLKRLRERQAEEAATDAALQSLDSEHVHDDIASRLEAAGFGKRTKPTAGDVLERLRQRAADAASGLAASH